MALSQAHTKHRRCAGPRLAALVALTASLSACGTVADDPLLGVARGLVQGAFNRAPEAPAIDPRQVLTRDIINQAGVPLILVENPGDGGSVTMVRIATNGVNETWQGDGGATITLSREGVLRATRGLGPDLSSSDIADTRRALVQGGGQADRLYVHVVGDLNERRLGYTCDIARTGREQITIFGQSHSLTHLTETCTQTPTGDTIQNHYWTDSTGLAWAAQQWAGPELGHITFERLHR